MRSTGSRYRVFTDEQWERIEPLLPSNSGRRGHPFGDNRRVVEGITYRYRTGIPWRDLPREQFGPWQTVWKRHRRYAGDGTWGQIRPSQRGRTKLSQPTLKSWAAHNPIPPTGWLGEWG